MISLEIYMRPQMSNMRVADGSLRRAPGDAGEVNLEAGP